MAVIGLAFRFPGATTVEQFWQNLCSGIDATTWFTDGPRRADSRGYVAAGLVLDNTEWFDADLFGISHVEAQLLDPQQRLLLECAWEALDIAAYNGSQGHLKIGVYAGSSRCTYFDYLQQIGARHLDNEFQCQLANDADYLATRLAYRLNLTGPAVSVQTACSTALVAVHLACQSLRAGECDLAIAGAATVRVPHRQGYFAIAESHQSPDGQCSPFGAAANGTVFGNGVGTIILKRLDDAMDDGDFIWAVVKGSAINNDGNDKVGFAAPSVSGQARVIQAAHADAGVTADDIQYVEAHGTGTRIGDPIEVMALKQAFAGRTAAPKCRLGSVKGNLGHLDSAAGMAGLIKTILALQHGRIPASLRCDPPNPRLDLPTSQFELVQQGHEWTFGEPAVAGVSAFGIGGTNAHIILERAPSVRPSTEPGDEPHGLILSAQSLPALFASITNLIEHWQRYPELSLADVAWTLQVGRRALAHRWGAVVRNRREALQVLKEAADGREGRSAETELELLVHSWRNGHPVDWPVLHPAGARRRVPLPATPFQRQRYWRDPPADTGILGPMRESPFEECSATPMLYRWEWISTSLTQPAKELLRECQWLIAGGQELAGHLERFLQSQGCLTGLWSSETEGNAAKHIYATIERRRVIVVDLSLLELEQQVDYNREVPQFVKLFDRLRRDIVRWADLNAARIDLLIATGTCHQDSPPASVFAKALASGLVKVAPQEFPSVTARQVELLADRCAWDFSEFLGDLVREAALAPAGSIVRLQGGTRQELREIPLPCISAKAIAVAEDAYLFFGGLAGVGLPLLEGLLQRGCRQFGLMFENDFPAMGDWESALLARRATDPVAVRIKRLQELQRAGIDLEIQKGSLNNADEIRPAVEAMIRRFGRLTGVIHVAGSGNHDTSWLRDCDVNPVEMHFSAKVGGTAALAEALTGVPVGIVVLCSSMSTVLGGLGYGAYAVANAFLDGVAQRHHGNTPWLSVNLDPWCVGSPEEDSFLLRGPMAENCFSIEQGQAALIDILQRGAVMANQAAGRLSLAKGELSARIARWTRTLSTDDRTPRPEICCSESKSVESALCAAWHQTLGVSYPEPDCRFEAAGGESLNAIAIVGQLTRVLGQEIPLGTILGVSTFGEQLAELLRVVQRSQTGKPISCRTAVLPDRTAQVPESVANVSVLKGAMGISLYFFGVMPDASDEDSYQIIREAARVADACEFEALWIPERHFDPFGGLFPSPSVVGAALASATNRIHIRAGSIVLPLHHPVRVAEDWSVIDQLSGGRVGVAFAPGWNASDFVLAPTAFADRHDHFLEGVNLVRRLWRGDAVSLPLPDGTMSPIQIFPRPRQSELPAWLAASTNPESFRRAGAIGVNLLTHLLGQSDDRLARNLEEYRVACLKEHKQVGRITLMVHTFLGSDTAIVREQARAPLRRYLDRFLDLSGELRHLPQNSLMREELLDQSVERYLHESGLFGTADTCLSKVRHWQQMGVNEIACLIDFGLERQLILDGLEHLDKLRKRLM